MWDHPITTKQIRVLEEEWGVNGVNPDEGWFEVLLPQVKTLACGDFGQGGMRDWQEIVAVIVERLCLESSESKKF
jgi:phosphopantothenoylcysteine decarboxylase